MMLPRSDDIVALFRPVLYATIKGYRSQNANSNIASSRELIKPEPTSQ